MCAVSGDGPLAIAGSVNARVGTTSNAAVTAERRWTSEPSTNARRRTGRQASTSPTLNRSGDQAPSTAAPISPAGVTVFARFNPKDKNGNVDRTHRLVSDEEAQYDVAVRLWVPGYEDNAFLVYRSWLYGVGCSHIVQDVVDGTLLGYTVDSKEAESWRRMREHVQTLGLLG
jgi:hypothetical protein